MCPRVFGIAAASALVRHQVEEKIRERKAGERPVKSNEPEKSVVPGVEALLVVMEELTAEFDRMSALDPGDFLVDLIGQRERRRIGCDGSRQREPAAPTDLAQTCDRLSTSDAICGVGRANPGPVHRVLVDGRAAVADEQLVDQ